MYTKQQAITKHTSRRQNIGQNLFCNSYKLRVPDLYVKSIVPSKALRKYPIFIINAQKQKKNLPKIGFFF